MGSQKNVVNMRKVLYFATIGIALSTTTTFAQTESTQELESIDGTEKVALYNSILGQRSTFEIGKAVRKLSNKAYNLSYFGAVPGSVSASVRHSNTSAFATAWAAIQAVGGTIIVDGKFDLDSMDLHNNVGSNFENVDIQGISTSLSKLTLFHNGIAIGCEGRNYLKFKDLSLVFAANPKVGILYCRTAASPNCNNNVLDNVHISGSASVALVATIAAESFRCSNSKITSNSTTGGACYITSPDNTTLGITGTIAPILLSSNTDLMFSLTEMYHANDSASVLVLDRSADIKFFGCSFIVGNHAGSSIARFKNSIDVFEGVVLFEGCLFEASENPFVFYNDFSPNYYRNINVKHCFINNYGFIGGFYTDVVKYVGPGFTFHYNFNWEANRFSDLNPKLKTAFLIDSRIYHHTNGATFEPGMIINSDVDVSAITNNPTIQNSRVVIGGVQIFKHLPQIDDYADTDYTSAPVGAMLVWSASNTLSETPGNIHIKQ